MADIYLSDTINSSTISLNVGHFSGSWLKIFTCFKSRWVIPCECKKDMAFAIPYKLINLCISHNPKTYYKRFIYIYYIK